MAAADSHQVNGFSADPFSRFIPRQPPSPAPDKAWVPPAPANNRREDIPLPNRDIAEPGRMQDLHHIDVGYQGIADYHPQPLANPGYIFPDVEHAQGIPVQVQPNAPVNQEHNPFGYVPQYDAPGLVRAAFPHPFVHRTPTPDRPLHTGAENLRRLAGHYLHHPDAHVSMVTMETSTAGRIKVAVIFETPDF